VIKKTRLIPDSSNDDYLIILIFDSDFSVLDIVGNIKSSWETQSNYNQTGKPRNSCPRASFRIKQKGRSILRLHPDWSPKDEMNSFGAQRSDWTHR
jgi:hypothetical protein